MKRCILLLVLAVMVFGCTQKTEPLPAPQPEPEPAPEPTELGVSRVIGSSTVAPGETVAIRLYINLNDTMTYYLLEEQVPTEFEVTVGQPDSSNKLKLITIQNAESKVEEYQVKAPGTPGTYTFSGEYAVDGMIDPAPIMGDTTITVQ